MACVAMVMLVVVLEDAHGQRFCEATANNPQKKKRVTVGF